MSLKVVISHFWSTQNILNIILRQWTSIQTHTIDCVFLSIVSSFKQMICSLLKLQLQENMIKHSAKIISLKKHPSQKSVLKWYGYISRCHCHLPKVMLGICDGKKSRQGPTETRKRSARQKISVQQELSQVLRLTLDRHFFWRTKHCTSTRRLRGSGEGDCPNWGLNQQPLELQPSAPTTWPHHL